MKILQEMMKSYIRRRFWVYGTMGIIILLIAVIGSSIGANYLGKNEPVISFLDMGKIHATISSANLDSFNDSQVIVSSNIKSFVQITNNYNKTAVVQYTPYVMFEQKHVYNVTTYTFRLEPFASGNVTIYVPLEHQGENYLIHDFIAYTTDGNLIGTKENSQGYNTISQEMYYNLFSQATVYRYIVIPAIPLVIIAIKQVSDVWYKRYSFDNDDEEDD